MTTRTTALARVDSELMGIALAALLGLGLLFVAGFATAAGVHGPAHDQRHAVAFPCH